MLQPQKPPFLTCPGYAGTRTAKTRDLLHISKALPAGNGDTVTASSQARTADLLHAMNHSGILRAGNKHPDQPERPALASSSNPGELPRASICPSECPSR